ncbi:hypothetical protein RRG08_010887 [Elysia crispata]|uniref:Ferritin n=1 Tax=Elysia crispata TaxID=231223 RepID=A0AAE0YUU0_9GAST|nr:hypothetical protein RRG08_010887 [Elysia crispata]
MEHTAVKVFTVVVLVISVTAGQDMVEEVRQNLNQTVNDLLVHQINLELNASYFYQAYASYFNRADVDLLGIGQFFNNQSLEERGHANHLIEYLNKRGGHVTIKRFDLTSTCDTLLNAVQGDGSGLYDRETRMCICNFVANGIANEKCTADSRAAWSESLIAFEDALVLERYENSKLLELHHAAEEADDADLAHLLEHNLLEEQVATIYEIAQLIYRLRLFASGNGTKYKLGEFLLDQEFQKSPIQTVQGAVTGRSFTNY